MKYKIIGDYESNDGFKSNDIIIDECNTYPEARDRMKEIADNLDNGYSNLEIYIVI
jgi:hypothetical protein